MKTSAQKFLNEFFTLEIRHQFSKFNDEYTALPFDAYNAFEYQHPETRWAYFLYKYPQAITLLEYERLLSELELIAGILTVFLVPGLGLTIGLALMSFALALRTSACMSDENNTDSLLVYHHLIYASAATASTLIILNTLSELMPDIASYILISFAAVTLLMSIIPIKSQNMHDQANNEDRDSFESVNFE